MNTSLQKYLPSMVYGGSDGAVSYFALMAGAYGAGLPLPMILAVGISNIFADAFSMASADYLSEESKTSEDKSYSKRSAAVTFISFVCVGGIPLAPSFYAYIQGARELSPFVFFISILFTLFSFIIMGYIRGKILQKNILRTVLQSTLICSISACVAYGVGEYVAGLLRL